MTDETKLQQTWVEMSELSSDGKIVLKSPEADIPRSRAPRRQLDLSGQGRATQMSGSPNDALVEDGRGDWRLDGTSLQLTLKDWEGTYEVEELSDDTLILRRH